MDQGTGAQRAGGVPGKGSLVARRYGQGSSPPIQRKADTSEAVVHVVQPGDTLSAIARRYLDDVNKWPLIAQANGIDDPAALAVGQVLTIPGASAQTQQPEETTGSSGSAATDATETRTETSTAEETSAAEETSTVEESAEAETPAGTYTITDPKAFVRKPPPDLSSEGTVIPAGVKVRILETTRKDGRAYVNVEQVLQEGEEGTAEQYGWTSRANLSGFESGGHDKEYDESLRPDDAVLLAGLGSLDRQMALIYNAKGKYLHEQAQALGISTAAAAAVLKVESSGTGFANDGRMIIRFENHIFYDRWGKNNKTTFDTHFQYSSEERWKGHRFRASADADWVACHQSQNQEWEILEFARALSNDPALESISMGAAQIMGFNYTTEGYDSVQAMFDEMSSSIKPQLVGMFTFIENTPTCISGLREGDYVKFARGYNGAGQAQKYGDLIRDAADAFTRVTRGKTYGGS